MYELSMKETGIQLSDQNSKSQQNLIVFFFFKFFPSFVLIILKLNKRNSERFSNHDY